MQHAGVTVPKRHHPAGESKLPLGGGMGHAASTLERDRQ